MYTGTIIEESLTNTDVLKKCHVVKTVVSPVTPKDNTPHLKQWTLHSVEIPESEVEQIVQELSEVIEGDGEHGSWYADFKNEQFHYVIYPNKIFKMDLKSKADHEAAMNYGLSLGIPAHQVDFITSWEKANK